MSADAHGHEECGCQALLTTIQARSNFREFPFLERGDLSEGGFSLLTARLRRQFEELVFAFQQLTPLVVSTVHESRDHLEVSLVSGSVFIAVVSVLVSVCLCVSVETCGEADGTHSLVTLQALINFLETRATNTYLERGPRGQSLAHPVLTRLTDMKSPDQMLEEVHSYSSAFTHQLLTGVLEAGLGDNKTNQLAVNKYFEKLNFYNQRPIAQAPCLYTFPRKYGRAFLTFHLSLDPNKVTINEMDDFRSEASSIFNVTHYVLMLISVEMEGSAMVQTYQIPASLTNTLFPLDDEQLTLLEANNVLKVECCGRTLLTKVERQWLPVVFLWAGWPATLGYSVSGQPVMEEKVYWM